MDTADTKTCTKCGETKPLSEFYKAKGTRDGRRPDCAKCRCDYEKRRREQNPEKLAEYERKRYQNPERRAANIAAAKKSYRKDLEASRAYRKAYYAANPEVYERARAKRHARIKGIRFSAYTRREIYERDGGTCRACQKRLPMEKGAFQIDHIVPVELGGPSTPDNLQLMCPTCNREKWNKLEGQIHLPV